MCLGKCGKLLSQWVGPDSHHGSRESLKLFLLRALVRKALSQVIISNSHFIIVVVSYVHRMLVSMWGVLHLSEVSESLSLSLLWHAFFPAGGRSSEPRDLLPLIALGTGPPSGRSGSLQHIHQYTRSPVGLYIHTIDVY